MNGGWKFVPAAAALIVSGMAFSTAKAADLGGDCCADLEERVAELEATTVRKGNRKVSVKVSGFVSKSVMFWDDGVEENVYVGDTNGSTLASNFSITGSAQIASGWTAGYDLVIEADGGTNLSGLNADNDNGTDVGGGSGIGTLVSSMWIKSDTYGKISWGKQSQASDNAALLPDLSGTIIQANYVYAFHGGGFGINAGGAPTGFVWGDFTPCATSNGAGIALDCNGAVLNNVRYDSPTIAGFSISASWGEDDFWDVAVNYAGQWGDVKVKAAYAYTNTTDLTAVPLNEVDLHQVGASLLHVPTGLFVYGAYMTEDPGDASFFTTFTDSAWYVKAGIRQKWTSLGETVIYGEYGKAESELFVAPSTTVGFGEFERYGAGIVQYIDAAALQLHAVWKHNDVDFDVGSGLQGVDADELDMFIVGGTIFF